MVQRDWIGLDGIGWDGVDLDWIVCYAGYKVFGYREG